MTNQRPPDILSAIDGALGDWAVSKDAMRWVPEGSRTEEKRLESAITERLQHERSGPWLPGLSAVRAGEGPWSAVSWADISLRPSPAIERLRQAGARDGARFISQLRAEGSFSGELCPEAARFAQAIAVLHADPGVSRDELPSLASGILALASPAAPNPQRTLAELRRNFDSLVAEGARLAHRITSSLRPAEHARCVTCHPRLRQSKPLAVDGHEYQRRLKARRRRKR